MAIEFALDAPHLEAAERLEQIILAGKNLDWFALLDTAFDYGKPGFAFQPDALNCFEGVIFLDEIKSIAPVLVPLLWSKGGEADGEVPPRLLFVKERIPALLAHRAERPMLSFLGVERGVTAADLAAQWRPLHFMYPADGDRYFLRFADTRTLAKIPKFLEPAQWQAFHQNIAQWHIIGRNGKPEEIPLEKADKRPPHQLNVTEQQFAKMVELDEPDVALSTIKRTEPDLIPEEMTGYRFYELTTRLLKRAEHYDITHWGDKGRLIILTIGTNGEILDDPGVDAWMKAKEWKEGLIAPAIDSAACFERWR